MTIKELIEALKSYPEDMKVLVNGYENGYDEMQVREVMITPNMDRRWWEGKFSDSRGDDPSAIKVLILSKCYDE